MPQAASAMDRLPTMGRLPAATSPQSVNRPPALARPSWLQLVQAEASIETCMEIYACNRVTAKKQIANAQIVLAIPVKDRLSWHLKKTVADEVQVPLIRVKDASHCSLSPLITSGRLSLHDASLPHLQVTEYYGINEALDYSKAA